MGEPEVVGEVVCELGEGPIWRAAERALWWVDILAPKIWRFEPGTGAVDVVARPGAGRLHRARSRGATGSPGLKSGLHRFDPAAGSFTRLHTIEDARLDNRLNDAFVDAAGRLWFGSMHDAKTRPPGRSTASTIEGSIRHDEGYGITNGPSTSPDGRTFYHTDTQASSIYAFDLSAGGRAEPTAAFSHGSTRRTAGPTARRWTPRGACGRPCGAAGACGAFRPAERRWPSSACRSPTSPRSPSAARTSPRPMSPPPRNDLTPPNAPNSRWRDACSASPREPGASRQYEVLSCLTASRVRPFRSRDWFGGRERPDMTALYTERFMATGLTADELRSGRPIIGIAQSGSDLNPCNLIHVALAKRVRDGIRDAGGVPLEFPVHPIFEEARRPTAALDRNLAYLGAGGDPLRLSVRRGGPDHRLRQDHAVGDHGRGDGGHSGHRPLRRPDARRLAGRASPSGRARSSGSRAAASPRARSPRRSSSTRRSARRPRSATATPWARPRR